MEVSNATGQGFRLSFTLEPENFFKRAPLRGFLVPSQIRLGKRTRLEMLLKSSAGEWTILLAVFLNVEFHGKDWFVDSHIAPQGWGEDLSSYLRWILSSKLGQLPPDEASLINAALSRRLAQERELRGISKKRLAALAKIDRTTVAFIEDPEKNPTIQNLLRYTLALGIDLGELLSECRPAKRPSRETAPRKTAK